MSLRFPVLFFAFVPFAFGASASAPTSDAALEQSFKGTVRPFVETYCVSCHGKEDPESDLDLSPYTNVASVVSGFSYWELVLERLEAGEMPPSKAKKHPTKEQSAAIVAWLQTVQKHEAAKTAGDPGVVLARRLSNAEYDYTIRDLTGQDLHPSKEFPLDPANQAGFTNSGESLAMSPALWKKYYLAARAVADNVVFQPQGFAFASHPMLDDNDRDKYSILRIVDFYLRQPTDYSEYFLAAWRYQHRAALGRPQATLAEVAAETKVSAKYLGTVWTALNDTKEQVGPIAKLQILWRALPAPAATDPVALRAHTEQMRDWVLNLRDQLVPVVKPSRAGGAQPNVLWMDRQMAANRRAYDSSRLKPGTPTVQPNLPDAGTALVPKIAANPTVAVTGGKAPVAVVNPIPLPGAKLAAGLGMPVAPVAKTAADGRALSALEIADLALAAQPARKAGGPLPKTPDIVKFGGVFLEPQVVTTASSVTAQMARAKKRGNAADPDLIVPEDAAARAPYEAAFARFSEIFPDAFFISERARVLNDAETEASLEGRLLSAGLHAQTGYFRDDGPLRELILSDAEARQLDQLWDTFNYNAEVPLRMHLAYLSDEGGSQKGPGFEAFRPENRQAATQEMIKKLQELTFERLGVNVPAVVKEHFEHTLADNLWLDQTRAAAEPTHLNSLLEFAARAWRRTLTKSERDALLAFYHESREANGLEHTDAIRDCVVRVLMSPNFCYRIDLVEAAGGGDKVTSTGTARPGAMFASVQATAAAVPSSQPAKAATLPLSDDALASRLSYFLWSSLPDAELLAHAAAGDLHRPEVLTAQAQRMLKDPRVRGLATEFVGNWLDFRQFEDHNAVDRERFPQFDNDLREAMFQEPIRFFVDLVQNGRPVKNFLYADYTFVNATLAKHYGMTDLKVADNNTWVRAEHADQFGRGGLLPMAVFLTANSPGLRTSPVKRGYWVARRVLGDRIPPPPPNVPVLPADEKNLGELTLREAMAKHRENAACAGCHARFDAFGLVFEGYGAIGERREKDFAGRPVQTDADFPGGGNGSGLAGLRANLQAHRDGQFIDNLSSKFLAYGLGRTLLLSDGPLLDEMKAKLAASGGRFDALVTAIVTSPQFLTKRAPAARPAQITLNR